MKDPPINSQDLKGRMKQLANTYLTCRQMGEAEAVYRLMPSMTLSMSNIGCQFVALGPKEERSSRWRKATEAELLAGVPVEELENHEGLWYEQQDMWSKYLRRPHCLDSMCFAQFAKMYKTKPKTKSAKEDEEGDGAKRRRINHAPPRCHRRCRTGPPLIRKFDTRWLIN